MGWVTMEEACACTFTVCRSDARFSVTSTSRTELTTTVTSELASAKPGGAHGQSIVAGQQIVEAEFSAAIGFGLAFEGRRGGPQGNIRGLDAAAARIGDGAGQAAAKILGVANDGTRQEGEN